MLIEVIKSLIYIDENLRKVINMEDVMSSLDRLGIQWFVDEIEKADVLKVKKAYSYLMYKYFLAVRRLNKGLDYTERYDSIFENTRYICELADVFHNLPLFIVDNYEKFDHRIFWIHIYNDEILRWLQLNFLESLYLNEILRKEDITLLFDLK